MPTKYAYVDATGKDTSAFHPIIMAAIANGGVFDEDCADTFVLVKTPEGSAAKYVLKFA